MTTIESVISLKGQLIEKRFLIGKLVGKGSFGDVYEACDNNNGNKVAVKFEHRRSTHAQLKNEYNVSFLSFQSKICS